jgi:hypothetical protein
MPFTSKASRLVDRRTTPHRVVAALPSGVGRCAAENPPQAETRGFLSSWRVTGRATFKNKRTETPYLRASQQVSRNPRRAACAMTQQRPDSAPAKNGPHRAIGADSKSPGGCRVPERTRIEAHHRRASQGSWLAPDAQPRTRFGPRQSPERSLRSSCRTRRPATDCPNGAGMDVRGRVEKAVALLVVGDQPGGDAGGRAPHGG